MMKSSIFILSLISFCCAQQLVSLSDSSTAHFTLLSKNNRYEHRRYEKFIWFGIAETILIDEDFYAVNFTNVCNYINGENSDGTEVKVASPVITALGKRSCAFCPIPIFKGFHMSPDQTYINLPLTSKISFYIKPNLHVYVKKFEGSPSIREIIRKANILLRNLKRDGITESDLNLEYFYIINYKNGINEVGFATNRIKRQPVV